MVFDGLSVLVNPENDFVDCMTVDQLNALWKPDSTVSSWSDIDPSMAGQEDQPIWPRHGLGHIRLLH